MKSFWRIGDKVAGLLLAAGAAFSGVVQAVPVADLAGGPAVRQLNLPYGVTKIAQEQYLLHNGMMVLCTVIFLAVFAVMFYSIWKHRKSVGHKAANFHESVVVEVIWTIVPFVIVILMALPATKILVAQKDTTNADLTIKATGYQWKWGYDYIKGEGEGLGMISTIDSSHRAMSQNGAKGPNGESPPVNYLLKVDNPLVVPVDKKVRIITTAGDVIHAFAVQSLGIQQDAIPGFVRDTWFRAEEVGDYYGQCAKLCGKEHSYMPIHVKVVSSADYTLWVDGKKKEAAAKLDDPAKVWALPDMMARGEGVYAKNCAVCHQANGKGGGAIKALDADEKVLNPDHAVELLVLLNGQNNGALCKPGEACPMQSWAKMLNDTDIAAVATYTKNTWSNKTGQLVQPAEVLALRAK